MTQHKALTYLLIFLSLLACKIASTEMHSIQLATERGPASVAITDLNADGKLDIVVANQESNSATMFLGNGKGEFTKTKASPVSAGDNPNDIVAGDFNNDQKQDVAFSNHETSYVTLLIGDGSGDFVATPDARVPVQSRPHPHGIAAADFNKDGNLDLIVESWEVDQVELLFGDGTGKFDTPGKMLRVGRMPYQRLRAVDINQDGNPDVLTTNFRGQNITILLGDGKGNFGESQSSPVNVSPFPFAITFGDFDGNNIIDIAIAHYSGSAQDTQQDRITILATHEKGEFHAISGLPAYEGKSPVSIAAGDVDGDGIDDVATANYGSNDVTLFLPVRNGRARMMRLAVGRNPLGIALGDLNGDKKADIVAANSRDNNISIWFSGEAE